MNFTFVLHDFLLKKKHNRLKYSDGLETRAYLECSLWALAQLSGLNGTEHVVFCSLGRHDQLLSDLKDVKWLSNGETWETLCEPSICFRLL
jgi:hypothetical protein